MGILMLLINLAYAQSSPTGFECELWKTKRYFETNQTKDIEHSFEFELNDNKYHGLIFIKNAKKFSNIDDYGMVTRNGKTYTTLVHCKKI